MSLFTSAQLAAAHSALPAPLRDTPLVEATAWPGLWLKLEGFQPTGAYKTRAAWTALGALDPEARRRGVALSSSGNFAAAFTWAAHRLGVPAHLVLTPSVSGSKMGLAQRYPCTLHPCPDRYEARYEELARLSAQGLTVIDHRWDESVFLGHATLGWECLGVLDRVQRVLVPLSTGGLAIGTAEALRAGGYRGQVIGVQPAGNPTLFRSWREGRPVPSPPSQSCCDALTATSIPERTFEALRARLDDVLLVQESSVLQAVRALALEEGLVAEPGAAVGLAAVLEGQVPAAASLLLVTGRNIEPELLRRCLRAEEGPVSPIHVEGRRDRPA